MASIYLGAGSGALIGYGCVRMLGMPFGVLYGVAGLGVALGLLVERWSWSRYMTLACAARILLDGRKLEILGVSRRRALRVSLRVDDIASIEHGDRELMRSPVEFVSKLAETILVVRTKDGQAFRFELFELLFQPEDLVLLVNFVKPEPCKGD